jgi:cardiolipin synthase
VADVPNFLSYLRIGLAPILLLLAYFGQAQLFFAGITLSMLTDFADGYLARRLNAATTLGAKLDSWADFATCSITPLCAWWLRPDALQAELILIVVAVTSYAIAVVFGFLKYGQLTSYHTWLWKFAALCADVVILIFFAGGPGWILRTLAPVVLLAALEEIAITSFLKHWQPNVPSLLHALKLRHQH